VASACRPDRTVTAVAAPALTPRERNCRMTKPSETADPAGTETEMAVRASVMATDRRSVMVPPNFFSR
jgi:hypothetical protein